MNFEDALANPATKEVTLSMLRSLSRSDVRIAELQGRGVTPLHVVGTEHIQLFVANGADPNARDKAGMTPLHHAVCHEDAERARELLKHRADVNAIAEIEREGTSSDTPHVLSPLHMAQSDTMAQVLLEHGGDLHARDERGRTPFHYQMLKGDTADVVALLLQHGVDVNMADHEGNTPLHQANVRQTEMLLDEGANVNARNLGGRTPLHAVAGNEIAPGATRSQVMRLLDAGADVNARDNAGETPLHFNMRQASNVLEPPLTETGRLLLERGADPFIANNAGQSPHDMAIESGDLNAIGAFGAHRRQREAQALKPERSRERIRS